MTTTNRNHALAFLLAAAALQGSSGAQTLTIGSEAPPLDIAHWLKGEAVTGFSAGQVYVLEFWATWCAPCVANMEHLSQVQERYAGRGVHVIGLSDEPLQTTVAFLCKRYGEGQEPQFERTRYALATDSDRSVHKAYFEAAGLSGIPAVFLIGKDGKIEWIGHPAAMDAVLEAVVADRWDRAQHRAKALAELEARLALRQAEARLRDAVEHERWEDALAALDVLVTSPDDGDLYVPTVAGILLSRLKDGERGYAYVRRIATEHWDDNSWLLYQMAWLLSGNPQFPLEQERRDLDLALKYARRAVELDPFDYYSTMLAGIHAQRGELDAAASAQRRAIDLLEGKRAQILPHELERFEAELAAMRATLAEYEARGK
jgi:thiol-disulfide isomerase/thioredoxin